MKYSLSTGLVLLCSALIIHSVNAAGIRDHTRPKNTAETTVSPSQADVLTLTLVTVAKQDLQTWLRLAASLKQAEFNRNKIVRASVCSNNAKLIKIGQRVRVFSANSKSSIIQARISTVSFKNNCAMLNAQLAALPAKSDNHFIIEILITRGKKIAIPNEAIIEEGFKKIVYRKMVTGGYQAVEIQTGIHGELYTEISVTPSSDLHVGDQVVTLGSFFIDAQFKLKSATPSGTGHAHLHH